MGIVIATWNGIIPKSLELFLEQMYFILLCSSLEYFNNTDDIRLRCLYASINFTPRVLETNFSKGISKLIPAPRTVYATEFNNILN